MSKFKVGDRVKCIKEFDNNAVAVGKVGTVIGVISYKTHVEFDDFIDGHSCGGEGKRGYCWNFNEDYLELAKVDRYELHITCNDGKTTNAVYKENGKIVKHEKAVCAPSDTFDFVTGAETAFGRVFPRIAQSEPKTTQPAEDNPKQEPIKLYCYRNKTDVGVHDYSKYLTVGKIYEFDGHRVNYENLACGFFKDFADWKFNDFGFASCLVPLVSRPAKVGEWVYVVGASDAWRDGYEIGDIIKVKSLSVDCPGVIHRPFHICGREYLVLDGYAPEPEKVEPAYYSGKVVCVDNGGARYFEVGKVYQFVGGRIFGAHGFYSSQYETLEKANSRYGVGAKFIEYKGEQS